MLSEMQGSKLSKNTTIENTVAELFKGKEFTTWTALSQALVKKGVTPVQCEQIRWLLGTFFSSIDSFGKFFFE
jgi:hypothetical protein